VLEDTWRLLARTSVYLERDTTVGRVLQEDTSVDLALVQVRRLVSAVGDIRGSSRLLKYTKLELTATGNVNRLVGSNTLQLGGTDGVVNADLAAMVVKNGQSRTWKGVLTSCCSQA
jgi:hypothetical protein